MARVLPNAIQPIMGLNTRMQKFRDPKGLPHNQEAGLPHNQEAGLPHNQEAGLPHNQDSSSYRNGAKLPQIWSKRRRKLPRLPQLP
jgi:hypothetical protein